MELEPEYRMLERLADLPAAQPLMTALGDGEGIYLVGGAVRDLLLGTDPLDLDLVVEGDPQRLITALGAPAHVHDRFGTATVEIAGVRYDIARARRESYPRPGALPTVSPASIDDDLARRDFTANALALGLAGRRRGTIVGVPGALEDLRARRLRVLHDGSFSDDPTRMLRLARYASRLGFGVEDGTRTLAGEALQRGVLDTVTGARLGAELRLLAQEADPVQALSELRDLGIDEALQAGFGLRDPALAGRGLDLLGTDGNRGALVLAAASLSLAPPILAALLDRLAFPAQQRDLIVVAAGSRDLAQGLGRAVLASEIAAAAQGRPAEAVALAGALGPASAAARWLDELRHVELEIDGGDLVAAGVSPGPRVGAGLRAALAAKLDGEVTGRAEELARALRAAGSSG